MGKVDLIGQKAMNRRISHLTGVKGAVYSHAVEIQGKAENLRAQHYVTGNATIEISQGDTDAYVSLVDEAAVSIEFGHINARTGKYTPGTYIITRAAGLA